MNIHVGIIGTGVGIRTHLAGFRKVTNAEVVAISGSSPERAKYFAEREHIPVAAADFRELCARPDIALVCVTSPNPLHYEHAICALENGKHVLCEKPLATSVKETNALIHEAKRFPSQIALVNHQLRFNPYLRMVRQIVREGRLGKPYFVRIHQQSTDFSNVQAPWNWSFEAEMGGGVRLAMASHLVDLVNFWFGRTCFSVRGAMHNVVPQRIDAAGRQREIDVSAFFSASLALDGGIDVQMSATAAACGEKKFEFSVYGDKGELHFDLEAKLRGAFVGQKGQMRAIDTEGVTEEERANKISVFSGSFLYFAPRIVNAVETGNHSLIEDAAGFSDALKTHIILDAIRDSATIGTTITLAPGYIPFARI